MNKNNVQKDRLYAELALPGDFTFDEKVAHVFEDMICRSVPGYKTIVSMIGVFAERYYQKRSRIYDLGCSLGGATFAVCEHFHDADFLIIAVDNSPAMIKRLDAHRIQLPTKANCIKTRCEDIQDTLIENASVVILNFTLQFLPLDARINLINKIYAGMRPGGILIISEKIVFTDSHLNRRLVDMYHQFKEQRGYSKLEVSRKRIALENVLIPETIDTHRSRLASTGFHSFEVWFQCFNFASMIAIK